jgi:hypothetical protein
MNMLTTDLDVNFRREMADRFPKAAFSCLSGSRIGERAMAPGAWLASLPSRSALDVEEALVLQLGQPWTGLDAETPVRQAALLAIAAYACGHGVDEVLADLNMWAVVVAAGGSACDPCALVADDVRAVAMPLINATAAGHAWSHTVALGVVRQAKRSNGVMANGHYLWLAAHDRALWLLLDGFGRREPSVETLGVVAHEGAERLMCRPLEVPIMNDVASALLDQLSKQGVRQ